jgi:hypothetical protein
MPSILITVSPTNSDLFPNDENNMDSTKTATEDFKVIGIKVNTMVK